jgi:hypothetical protein
LAIRLQITLVVSLALVSAMGALGQSVSSCNPEMLRYPEWSAARHFPYNLDTTKQQEIATGLSQLSLGLTTQQVKAAAGVPDFASDGSLQSNAVACLWFYIFEDPGPQADPKTKRAVLLGFSGEGRLVAVESQRVKSVKTLEPKHKSCEAYDSPTASTIAAAVNSGKPYIAPEHRQAKIRSGYGKLTLGMGVDETQSLLGAPDSINVTPHGQVGSAWILGTPCKRQLVYVLRQNSNNPVDPTMEAIYLTFDGDKLFWAAPLNMQGMKTMGKAAR